MKVLEMLFNIKETENNKKLHSRFFAFIIIILQFIFLLPLSAPAQEEWVSVTSGTTEHLRGGWIAPDGSAFTVGDAGTILHCSGTSCSPMPSGTTNDLYDVWGAAIDKVVASGPDVVLYYNGSSWANITPYSGGNFTPVWISPNGRSVFVGDYGDSGSWSSWRYLNRYDTELGEWNFYSVIITSPVMAFCGSDNDVTFVQQSGSIMHTDNNLNISDVYNHTASLNLYAAWLTPDCSKAFGFNYFGMEHFNGSEWTRMDTSINDNIFAINGVSSNDVYAVGIDSTSTNGVAWHYDGTGWSKETLPGSPPGFIDVATGSWWIVGEYGSILKKIIRYFDIKVTKDDVGVKAVPGETIIYTITVSNAGNRDVTDVPVVEEVPEGTTFIPEKSDPRWSCDLGVCRLTIDLIKAGESVEVKFAVKVNLTQVQPFKGVSNTARAGDIETDPTPGNNEVTIFTPSDYVPEPDGTIIIKKITIPTGGKDFDFRHDIGGPDGMFTLDDGKSKTFFDVAPGEYTVEEFIPKGYQDGFVLTDLTCLDPDGGTIVDFDDELGTWGKAYIDLDSGETVECTFENTELGKIIIKKITDPSGEKGFNFTHNIGGQGGQFTLDDGQEQTFVNVFPGTYSVTESPANELDRISCVGGLSGTDPFDPKTAVIDLGPGERVKCNFYNKIIPLLDFGDAPDPLFDTSGEYPTLLDSNGARHIIKLGYYLGEHIDADTDGQPTEGADGDDTDEDGVVFTSALMPGVIATVEVTASASGKLNAWIDFNANGSWADAEEQVFTDEPLVIGLNVLDFTVPASASTGTTYTRFRFDSAGGLSFDGLASDGEVEDYQVEIQPDPCEQDVIPDTEGVCDDGLDNDCDTLIDLDDPDCGNLPDLVVKAVKTPKSTKRGGKLNVKVKVMNQGKKKAGKSLMRCYLLANEQMIPLAGGVKVKALSPGKSVKGKAKVKIPRKIKPGKYNFTACVNATQVVKESDDKNNCKAAKKKITVKK